MRSWLVLLYLTVINPFPAAADSLPISSDKLFPWVTKSIKIHWPPRVPPPSSAFLGAYLCTDYEGKHEEVLVADIFPVQGQPHYVQGIYAWDGDQPGSFPFEVHGARIDANTLRFDGIGKFFQFTLLPDGKMRGERFNDLAYQDGPNWTANCETIPGVIPNTSK
jgi:hypothetical protein